MIEAPQKTFVAQDNDSFRDKIATIDDNGHRSWIYPKQPKGKFYAWRTYLSYILLLFLFGMPFIKVAGEPILLFNILERRFIIFGLHFAPQDFHLFVFAMLIFIVFISLFTVVFGRLFCGWVCPQTIFMEMVYRKIEYWIEGDANAQKRLNKAPWTSDKVVKKTIKQILFFGIAVLVANTFLSYIIGVDAVYQIATDPIQQHLGGFIAMVVFSFAFYFVFAYMREQVCVTICPYGRLQSVLQDKDTIAVYYDFERGEPRGKLQKKRKNRVSSYVALPVIDTVNIPSNLKTCDNPNPCGNCQVGGSCDGHAHHDTTQKSQTFVTPKGDCIDCKLCVQVCPTGIDIRDGIQLECINCTACMDACDDVMSKIDKPIGLIRHDSYNGITQKRKHIFTNRVKAYSLVLVALLSIEIFLLVNRTDVETLFLRTPGMLFQQTDHGTIQNLYNYQIINKTRNDLSLQFRLVEPKGTLQLVGKMPLSVASAVTEGAVFVEIPETELTDRKTEIKIEVYTDEKVIDVISTNFLGPVK